MLTCQHQDLTFWEAPKCVCHSSARQCSNPCSPECSKSACGCRNLEILQRPPYSLDLCLCDFYISILLKKSLNGQLFNLDTEVEFAIGEWFRTTQRKYVKRLVGKVERRERSVNLLFEGVVRRVTLNKAGVIVQRDVSPKTLLCVHRAMRRSSRRSFKSNAHNSSLSRAFKLVSRKYTKFPFPYKLFRTLFREQPAELWFCMQIIRQLIMVL